MRWVFCIELEELGDLERKEQVLLLEFILVVSFVREKDAFLASKISPYIENKEKLDAIFSRNRSLRKSSRNKDVDSSESDEWF